MSADPEITTDVVDDSGEFLEVFWERIKGLITGRFGTYREFGDRYMCRYGKRITIQLYITRVQVPGYDLLKGLSELLGVPLTVFGEWLGVEIGPPVDPIEVCLKCRLPDCFDQHARCQWRKQLTRPPWWEDIKRRSDGHPKRVRIREKALQYQQEHRHTFSGNRRTG